MKIENYRDYKTLVVEKDLNDFLAAKDDLRKAWHCASSLFHLADWVYFAHKTVIDAKFKFVDDHQVQRSVSRTSEFANSLGQTYPHFQLIRGIANAFKHLELQTPPPGRQNPPGMPSHAANTYVVGSAFQPGVFSANAFQTGNVVLETSQQDIDFAALANLVWQMWNNLFAAEGW